MSLLGLQGYGEGKIVQNMGKCVVGVGQSEMSWEKNARRNREWFAGQRQ